MMSGKEEEEAAVVLNPPLSQDSPQRSERVYWNSNLLDTFFAFWLRVLSIANVPNLKCRKDCTPYLTQYAEEGAQEMHRIHGVDITPLQYLEKLAYLVDGDPNQKKLAEVYLAPLAELKNRMDQMIEAWTRIREENPIRFYFSCTHHNG